MKSDEFVLLGAIVKPHGIKGEVKVIPIDTDVLRFQNLDQIYIGSEKRSMSVEGFKNSGKFAILKIKGIDSIEDAQGLLEKEIFSTISNRPALEKGRFYISDLISLKVKDLYTNKTGLVTNVETYPANDVLICKFDSGLAKIPMIKEFIKEIDLDKQIIIVETIDGSRKEELIGEKGKLNADILNLNNEISENRIEYDEILKTIESNDESNELKIKKKDLIKNYNDIQIRNDEIRNSMLELEKRINYLELQEEKLNNKKVEIKEYLNEFYNIEINLDNLDNEIKKPETRISVTKVKSQMEKLGQINPQAIEAYNLTKERYEFNNNQYNDLINAKRDLEKLIANLDRNMKNVFYDSVEEINKNFKDIFKLLFGGGQAEILLIEPEDEDEPLLNSNIEIKACPPGKNMQTLSLLSGGEKALTSVAIIFSLLKTRPAPFCLLDEIDAALDDANIRRYMNYLETLKDIQFAIITHRKTTMEIGDTLYGITMQNPGISDIISMKLE